MLFAAERWRRNAPVRADAEFSDERIVRELSLPKALAIGTAQAIALLPGFSRSGAAMAGGLRAGLSNEDAARFSFLLATPIIGAAAVLKLPDLFGPSGDGIRGPALAGALAAALTAWLSVRFLVKYFETNRLTPFAIYCCVAGVVYAALLAALDVGDLAQHGRGGGERRALVLAEVGEDAGEPAVAVGAVGLDRRRGRAR